MYYERVELGIDESPRPFYKKYGCFLISLSLFILSIILTVIFILF